MNIAEFKGEKEGTPILVPDNFTLNAGESRDPRADLAHELLRESAAALKTLRSALRESSAEANEQIRRVQKWLKSAQAKKMAESSPNVKKAFASAAEAAASVAKERTSELEAQDKALRKIEASLADFLKVPRGPLGKAERASPVKSAKRSKRSPRPPRKSRPRTKPS